jgi:arginine repressor
VHEQNVLSNNERVTKQQTIRRTVLRDFIERNYGVPIVRNDMLKYLHARELTCSMTTLERDLASLSIMPIEAMVGGRKARFWAQVSYVPEQGPDNLRPQLSDATIENQAIKEIMRTAVDVFTDGKRVVITTGYEQAKHLALWVKNLKWPEIWYVSKEDGSVVIVETRSPERAEFLKKRFWGLRGDQLIGFEEEPVWPEGPSQATR